MFRSSIHLYDAARKLAGRLADFRDRLLTRAKYEYDRGFYRNRINVKSVGYTASTGTGFLQLEVMRYRIGSLEPGDSLLDADMVKALAEAIEVSMPDLYRKAAELAESKSRNLKPSAARRARAILSEVDGGKLWPS